MMMTINAGDIFTFDIATCQSHNHAAHSVVLREIRVFRICLMTRAEQPLDHCGDQGT